MKTSLEYFIVITEEKSVSKAASRLFLTPQNLNNYVKRLEDEYGTLFLRKPYFQLTPTGQALINTLHQIKVLEKNLEQKIEQFKSEGYGYLRIGIHSTSARMLLPSIVPKFRELYPSVLMDFYYNSVEVLEKLLLSGDIDIFFGVDVQKKPEFDIISLHEEAIYFVASKELLRQNNIDINNNIIYKNSLESFSYILSPHNSSFRKKIDSFCSTFGINLYEIIRMSDFELQLILVSKNQGACFCPQRLLGKIKELNENNNIENKLYYYRVENLNLSTNLSIVTHKLNKKSDILNTFIDVFCEEFPHNYYKDIDI